MSASLLHVKTVLMYFLVFALCGVTVGQSKVVNSASVGTEPPPVIDMLVQTMGEWDYPPPEITVGGRAASPTPEVNFSKTYEQFRKCNIVKAVVCGRPKWVETWKSKDEDDRIIRGLLMMKPDDWNMDPLHFESLVRKGKVQVFGEILSYLSGTTLSDPEWQPYLRICEKYDIPVAVHTGRGLVGEAHSWAPKARVRVCDPYLLEDVLVNYPKLRIYMCHAGCQWHEDVLVLMDLYPQLHTDVAAILWHSPLYQRYAREFLAKAKEARFLNRVMFSSDKMHWPHAIEISIEYLNSLDFLTEQDKRDILYNNAARFLKLRE